MAHGGMARNGNYSRYRFCSGVLRKQIRYSELVMYTRLIRIIYNSLLVISYITQGFILVAFSLLLFGKFCVGAYLYLILRGNSTLANTTCSWSP